ncbi:HAD family hydrolase [Paenibacillus roseipurpureus]|uniref:HAD family hydrolase n=1 Tax=Paenibacillus roseopurpureus TaxID=2918901 RepID=A0AA96RKD3_9BACL|nr:HAD family hydrolase [Paenibacillus sp. MBLB1832]WNR44196.1 HAD family hydrolase [Paenibacillus sp. MBLB1832]
MAMKAVLFDLDGTLLDRDTSLAAFVRDQYDRYAQFHQVDKGTFVQRFIDLDEHGYVWKDKVYQQLLMEYAIEGIGWNELLDDYLVGFQKHCVGYPHLVSMLTEVKKHGLKTALISNGYGQFQYDNAIFLRGASRLDVGANEAIFVGDHPENDIRASQAVGMKAVWKRNKLHESLDYADIIIDQLDELLPYVKSL